MAVFKNQSIGTFGKMGEGNTHEYVEVSFDETKVKGFSFHSVGLHDVSGNYYSVHGMQVDARYVFAAADAFKASPSKVIWVEGGESWVTQVWINKPGQPEAIEFRLGDKYGKTVARMVKTGYVQQEKAA